MNKKMITMSTLFLGLISVFVIRSFVISNYEFLFYGAVLTGFWGIIIATEKKLDYPLSTLILLTIWLAMHLFGGTVMIGETRLYDLVLFKVMEVGPIGNELANPILKYDQLIHVICYFTMTRLIYVPVKNVLKVDAPLFLVGLVTILAGAGIGAMNEVIEFIAVLFMDASEAVGGYTNTAIDIVCNTIGAIIGWISIQVGIKK